MSSNRTLVPNAKESMNVLKDKVLKEKGYTNKDRAKYEFAQDLGVPLQEGYNGNIKAKDAGKIGGHIGGAMVKDMIKMAQENMKKQ